jgi:L-alanine-DL-glutamate epimerase-like enolase superfamily enzyme
MRITDIKTILLTYELAEDEKFTWSAGTTVKRHVPVIQVATDEGLYGLGEVGDIGFSPEGIVSLVKHGFRELLVGEDPSQIQLLVRKMYHRAAPVGRKGLLIAIQSAIEIALWDMKGKVAGLPVYQLLGGMAHERIPAYASAGMLDRPEGVAAAVEQLVTSGYRAVKIRIGYGLQQDLEIVNAVKGVTGEEVDLMVDAAQGYSDSPWNLNTAIREARALEEFGLRWIEEPLAIDDLEGYIALARAIDTPIATGESEAGVYAFKDLVTQRGADVVQPDVTHAGGILECQRIAVLAHAYGIECAPHIFRGGVSLAANLHFAAATPNCTFVEYDQTSHPLRDEFLIQPVSLTSGFVSPPEAPGLGVFLPEGVEERYPYRPGPEVARADAVRR